MKKIELKRLELTNYRNIEHAIYEFNGNSKIVGDNRIGKTNTLESIYYLLTDALLGSDNDVSAIKPLQDTSKVVRVEGTFLIDGEEITIAKEYAENWVKERGTSTLSMKAHYTNYFINGIKQGTLKAYKQAINEQFGVTEETTVKIDFYKMLVDPYYLCNIGNSTAWTDLRAFIIKLVGDVNDDDVFNAKPETAVLRDDIKSALGKMDVVKKKIKADIDSANEKLIQDDAKIEMLEKTPNPTDEEVAIANRAVEDCNANIAALKGQNGVNSAIAQLKEKFNETQAALNSQKQIEIEEFSKSPVNQASKKKNEQLQNLYKENTDAVVALSKAKENRMKIENDIAIINKDIKQLAIERDFLLSKYKDIKNKINNIDSLISTECPTCHQTLPEELINETKENKLEELKKSLNEVNARGIEIKGENERLNSDLQSKNSELASIENEIASSEETVAFLKDKIKEISNSPFEEKQEIKFSHVVDDLEKQKTDILKEINRLQNEDIEKEHALNQQIFEEKEKCANFQKVIEDRNYYNRRMVEKSNIEKERKEHTDFLIDAEQRKELLNLFIYTKLKMLDENVAKVFGNIKFQLIKENINGGFDPVCKPYIYDIENDQSTNVLYKSGSKSERVITGVAIVECIKNKLGLPNLPYLFDEGGEISSDTFATKFKTDSQLICVKVEDNIRSPLVLSIN